MQFILEFKGYQFITAVFAGIIGGVQLQACAVRETCDQYGDLGAPGMGADFYVENLSFSLNVILVWTAFLLLPCSTQKGAVGALLKAESNQSGTQSKETSQRGGWRWQQAAPDAPTVVSALHKDDFDSTWFGFKARSQAGGSLMMPLLGYDFVCFTTSGALAAFAYLTTDGWHMRSWIFWCRVLYGIEALPFTPFIIPVVDRILLHARPTYYDRTGRCVPPLSMRDRQILEKYQVERLKSTVGPSAAQLAARDGEPPSRGRKMTAEAPGTTRREPFSTSRFRPGASHPQKTRDMGSGESTKAITMV